MIVAGTFLIGFAIKNIYDPVSMVTGGVSGVAIIAKELWSVPLWLTNTVLNIPLFAAGFFFCGWRFIKHPFCNGYALGFPVCAAGGFLSGKRPVSVGPVRGNHKRRWNRPGVPDQLHHRRYGFAGRPDSETP